MLILQYVAAMYIILQYRSAMIMYVTVCNCYVHICMLLVTAMFMYFTMITAMYI